MVSLRPAPNTDRKDGLVSSRACAAASEQPPWRDFSWLMTRHWSGAPPAHDQAARASSRPRSSRVSRMMSSGWRRSMWIEAVQRRRERNASRPAVEAQHRRARLLDSGLTPRFARRALGIEHVMPAQRDMEEVEGLVIVGRPEHDARAIGQIEHRHPHALDQRFPQADIWSKTQQSGRRTARRRAVTATGAATHPNLGENPRGLLRLPPLPAFDTSRPPASFPFCGRGRIPFIRPR